VLVQLVNGVRGAVVVCGSVRTLVRGLESVVGVIVVGVDGGDFGVRKTCVWACCRRVLGLGDSVMRAFWKVGRKRDGGNLGDRMIREGTEPVFVRVRKLYGEVEKGEKDRGVPKKETFLWEYLAV
jgi:hypothetical protein